MYVDPFYQTDWAFVLNNNGFWCIIYRYHPHARQRLDWTVLISPHPSSGAAQGCETQRIELHMQNRQNCGNWDRWDTGRERRTSSGSVVVERQAGEKGKERKMGKRNAVPDHGYLIYPRRGTSITQQNICVTCLYCHSSLQYRLYQLHLSQIFLPNKIDEFPHLAP